MKRFLTITVAVLLMAAVAAPALAWEFAMTGQWEYRMRYFARLGDVDLFGNAGLQNWSGGQDFVGFAGPRIYNRGTGTASFAPVLAGVGAFYADQSNPLLRIVKGGFSRSESDAFYSDSRLTFMPEIRVNPAIRVHGVYNVGGYRHKYFQALDGTGAAYTPTNIGVAPLERYYMSQTSMNAYDTAAIGSWEQFRATMQTPIGIFSLGVKDFPFGTGATLGYNTRAEAFLTVVPYGPFRFLHGIWLSRGLLTPSQESWGANPDSQSRNTLFQGILATYDSGPLHFGMGGIWRQTHLNRDELTLAGQPALAGAFWDANTLFWLVDMKYNNGRFFTNAEYAWITVDIYRGGQPGFYSPASGIFGPIYDEAYHWWWEVGAFAGPAKVSLLWAQASGPVRNLALNIGTGGATGNTTKRYRPMPINYQAMEAYEFLMFNTYAGGNAGGWNALDVAFVADDHGMMEDAYCFAGRVDYAVASNLNVFGSYIWAHRLERAGTWKGQFTATGADATAAQRTAFVTTNFGAASGEVGGPINPFVDDGFIGWEVNAGFAWKLLEGLNLNFRYSYWKPGEYFDQAIQGVGMAAGARVNNAAVLGKSPIQALTGSMVIDF
jgi:hypothetical protein